MAQTVSQQQALIPATDAEAQSKPAKKASYADLPNKSQLALLCIARLADPLANSQIQTYLFYQLRFFNPTASETLISTQAGILVGSKTAAQVCTGMLWGRVADSEYGGRKTVLLIGLISSGMACIGYGFSRSFVSAVAWQVFGGAMSSNVGIVRCVVAELNPEKILTYSRFRARALLLLPLFANAGMLLGPLLGGLLSTSEGYHGYGMLEAYPYALPNIFAAAIYSIAAMGVALGLEETLENIKHADERPFNRLWKKLATNLKLKDSSYTALNSEDPESPQSQVILLPLSPETPTPKPKSKLPFRRIWTWNVFCTMLAHFIIAGHLTTFTSLWAVFLSTPTAAHKTIIHFTGGLGMQPREVGFAMSALGAVGVVLQLVFYPMLNDPFGTIRIWRTALFIFPLTYALAPFPALLAGPKANDVLAWLAVSFILLLFILGRTGVTPATTLLINDCTPHPSVRGTIHTAGTVIGNLSRSLFPVAAFAIFGKGVEVGVVGVGFWCLAGLGVLACVASRWVIEGGNGKEIVLEGEEVEGSTGGGGGNEDGGNKNARK